MNPWRMRVGGTGTAGPRSLHLFLLPILPLHLLLARYSVLTASCVSSHLIALTETSLLPLYFGYAEGKTTKGLVNAAKAAN